MSETSPPGALTRSYPPLPESVADARRFVRAAVEDAGPEAVDTAELLVSELVTNAVLHARTEVEVAAWVSGGRVCARVGDHRPGHGPVPRRHDPCTVTGHGLHLVACLASRYGVDTDDERKTTWFELWLDGRQAPPSSWRSTAPPPGPRGTVTLVDLPGTLYLASQQQRHALLRELAFAASAGDPLGVRPEDLAAAHDANNVISACATAALEAQPTAAHIHSLRLSVPADAVPAVLTLRRVLDRAEQAAREERLLTWPALPQNLAFRQWLLDQIVGQLAGGPATAWTEVPREASAGASELAPWDADHVRSSRVPTIAADDRNRIIAANDPAADMLGWQRDDLVGRRLTTLIPEHLRERHLRAFSGLLRTGQPHILGRSVPLPALHRDGRLVPVRLLIQTQATADGGIVFVAQLTPRTSPPPPSPKSPEEERHAAPPGPDEPYPPEEPEPVTRTGGGGAEVSALERLSLLADTAGALSSTPELNEGLRRVGRIVTQRLSDWCAVHLLDEHDQVDRVCVVHRDPQAFLPAEAAVGNLPPLSEAARGALARVLRGAGPLLLTEIPPPSRARSPLDARHLELFEQMGASSAIVAPLRARQSVLGSLTVARTGGRRPFGEKERSLVGDLVHGLALGVDNARLHQETRHIAERLQRSLQPVLPEAEGLQLAARYAPSSTTAQVGGDWYDSFHLPDGAMALVIGDVTGSDLDAAVAMSQLRNMLRGIAVDRRRPPGEVLRRLDRANHSLAREAVATCIYALVEGSGQGPWTLQHSSAGHLPPLLTTGEGDAHYLEKGAGLLLGMDPDLPRPSAEDRLPTHSTLLLYTDGLIERRGESLNDSLAQLRRHTAALAREPLDVFCDELLIGLGADNADDIAVLAVRPTPAPARPR